MDCFRQAKKETIYPTITKLRNLNKAKALKCVADTSCSIYLELGDYDVERHRRQPVPSFCLDFDNEKVHLTINQNYLTSISVKTMTAPWLRRELMQWISCNHRKSCQ